MVKKAAREIEPSVIRCFWCFSRIEVKHDQPTAKCPSCGNAWRITWVTPNDPKIRGRFYGTT